MSSSLRPVHLPCGLPAPVWNVLCLLCLDHGLTRSHLRYVAGIPNSGDGIEPLPMPDTEVFPSRVPNGQVRPPRYDREAVS